MRSRFTWLIAVAAMLVAVAEVPAAVAQASDQEREAGETALPIDPGEALFMKRCAPCHSLAEGKNGNGPSLHRIVNRHAASVPGFKYSRAMRNMAADESLEWTEENLSAFLARPSLLVPGTRMAFPGVRNEEDLAVLVAWLKANSGPPSDKP